MQKDLSMTKDIQVRYSEMDYNLVLKPSALLQYLQDIASESAESLGFGYSFITKNNLAWFLLKYHIEFSKYPENIYNLTLRTQPRGYNKLFAFRDFEFFNGDESLGKVASTWAMVDLDTKNLASASEYLSSNPNMLTFEKKDTDLKYGKIPALQKIDIEKEFEIRFDDIDVNRHANNTNYLVWAFEPLDYDFRSNNVLKTLDIAFKKEIKYGQKVLSQIEVLENKTNHVLKCLETNEDLCLISAEWAKK